MSTRWIQVQSEKKRDTKLSLLKKIQNFKRLKKDVLDWTNIIVGHIKSKVNNVKKGSVQSRSWKNKKEE